MLFKIDFNLKNTVNPLQVKLDPSHELYVAIRWKVNQFLCRVAYQVRLNLYKIYMHFNNKKASLKNNRYIKLNTKSARRSKKMFL